MEEQDIIVLNKRRMRKKFLTIATDGLSEESEQKRREVDKRKDISG